MSSKRHHLAPRRQAMGVRKYVRAYRKTVAAARLAGGRPGARAGDRRGSGGPQSCPRPLALWRGRGAEVPEHAARSEPAALPDLRAHRAEEHTSELQSLMRKSYAVFCLRKT